MNDHAHWMRRCLELALNGAGSAAPNPMVGAVLVREGKVIAEGWHRAVGGPHAEVECLRAFGEGPVPPDATLYVNLEPCAHHGRTPPCADLLIARGVKHVVIGQHDPFPAVAGKGIARLQAAGTQVAVGVEEAHCRWTQRRFLTSIEQQRPYITLKWARSTDGLLDQHPRGARGVQRISAPETDVLVHRWRSEEQAILVGSRTVVNDDPSLTVRHVTGRSPLRVVIDREGRAPASSKVFNGDVPTLLITTTRRAELPVEQCVLGPADDPIDHLLHELDRRAIRSLIVEGGAELLGHFIARGLWDEARIITGTVVLGAGTAAPVLATEAVRELTIGGDRIAFHVNVASPSLHSIIPQRAWAW